MEKDMTGLAALQNVQYVTVEGKRFAVVEAGDWEELLEWLETIEDIDVAEKAYQQLKDAGGVRDAAGWHKWQDVRPHILTNTR
jgi:hypothetical protein